MRDLDPHLIFTRTFTHAPARQATLGVMRGGARLLLCERHAHTAWSDGELSLGAVVDLHGTAGFDALCVTDHVLT